MVGWWTAAGRGRTNSMLVSCRTNFRRRIDPGPSDGDCAGAMPAKPDRDQHAREGDGGEHRGRDADQQHDREALDRPRSEHQHDEARDRVRHVRLEDRAAGFLVAQLDRLDDAAPSLARSEEHTSELPSLMRHTYAVFCLKKKK